MPVCMSGMICVMWLIQLTAKDPPTPTALNAKKLSLCTITTLPYVCNISRTFLILLRIYCYQRNHHYHYYHYFIYIFCMYPFLHAFFLFSISVHKLLLTPWSPVFLWFNRSECFFSENQNVPFSCASC